MKRNLTGIFAVALALVALTVRSGGDNSLSQVGLAPTQVTERIDYLATDLLEPSFLSGPGYIVLPAVKNVGYLLNFTLRTPYGDILAESRDMLPVRIEEVSALRRLQNTGLTEAAGKKLRQRGIETWQSIKRVLMAPKETINGLPQGVARFVQNRARQIGRILSRTRDTVVDAAKKNEAAPVNPRPMSAARTPEAQNSKNTQKSVRIKQESKRLLKQQTGFAAIKRHIAQELSVDPYTTNPLLVEKLDALAWSAVGSTQAFNVALGALGTASFGILPQVLKIDKTVWEMAPEDLERVNRARLDNIRCTPGLTRRFVRAGAFTPTLETDFVVLMEKLAPSSGCDAVLDLALAAENQQEARFVVNSLRLILAAPLPGVEYLKPGQCHLQSLGGGIAAHCQRELLVPLPVDVLTWDVDIAAYLDAGVVAERAERTLLLSGFASERARWELTQRGFSIIENAPR